MDSHKSIVETMRHFQSHQSRTSSHTQTHHSSQTVTTPLLKYLPEIYSKQQLSVIDTIMTRKQDLQPSGPSFQEGDLAVMSDVNTHQLSRHEYSNLLQPSQMFTSQSDALKSSDRSGSVARAYEQTGHFQAQQRPVSQTTSDKYSLLVGQDSSIQLVAQNSRRNQKPVLNISENIHERRPTLQIAFNVATESTENDEIPVRGSRHPQSADSNSNAASFAPNTKAPSNQNERHIDFNTLLTTFPHHPQQAYSPIKKPKSKKRSVKKSGKSVKSVKSAKSVEKSAKSQRRNAQRFKGAEQPSRLSHLRQSTRKPKQKVDSNLAILYRSMDNRNMSNPGFTYNTIRRGPSKEIIAAQKGTKSQPAAKRKVKKSPLFGQARLRFPSLNSSVTPAHQTARRNKIVEISEDMLTPEEAHRAFLTNKFSSTHLTPMDRSINFGATKHIRECGKAKKSASSQRRSNSVSVGRKSKNASRLTTPNSRFSRKRSSCKSAKSRRRQEVPVRTSAKRGSRCKHCASVSRESRSEIKQKSQKRSSLSSHTPNSNGHFKNHRSSTNSKSFHQYHDMITTLNPSANVTPTHPRLAQVLGASKSDIAQTTASFSKRVRRNSQKSRESRKSTHKSRNSNSNSSGQPASALLSKKQQPDYAQLQNPQNNMKILSKNSSNSALDAAIQLQRMFFPGTRSRSPKSTKSFKSPTLPERIVYSYRRNTESDTMQGSTFRDHRAQRADLQFKQQDAEMKAINGDLSSQLGRFPGNSLSHIRSSQSFPHPNEVGMQNASCTTLGQMGALHFGFPQVQSITPTTQTISTRSEIAPAMARRESKENQSSHKSLKRLSNQGRNPTHLAAVSIDSSVEERFSNQKQDQTGFFGTHDLRKKWHGIMDKLDGFYRDRVAQMRQRVDQIVPAGIKTDDRQILKEVVREETRHVEEELRKAINLNQEKLIEELTAKLAMKNANIARLESNLGQAAKDLDLYKRKYSKLKSHKNQAFEDSIKDLKAQMEKLEVENRELGSKFQVGTQSSTQERTLQVKINDLHAQVQCAHELRQRLEREFADYKQSHSSFQAELNERAWKVREEAVIKEAREEAVQNLKAKYKAKLEKKEKQNYDAMVGRIAEVEVMLKEQHRLEMEALIARTKLHTVEIKEHESIVQRELDQRYEVHMQYINQLKQEHERTIEGLKCDAEDEQTKMRAIALTLEKKIESLSADYIKAMDQKDNDYNKSLEARDGQIKQLADALSQREREVAELEEQVEEAAGREIRLRDEVNYHLEVKNQEVGVLQENNEWLRRKHMHLCWQLRDKAEKIRRVRNEADLVKKLLQGELAMVKHEFEQRCNFILDMAKRNEKSSVKAFQDRDSMSQQLSKVAYQLEHTNQQSCKLATDLTEKSRLLEVLGARNKEMASEMEVLAQQAEELSKVTEENDQLRAEVKILHAKHAEDLQLREQELRNTFETKLQKKLQKVSVPLEEQIRFAQQQLQQLASECDEYRTKAFQFQEVILAVKRQKQLKRMRTKEKEVLKGKESQRIERALTKSLAKVQGRSLSRDDSSRGRSSNIGQHTVPSGKFSAQGFRYGNQDQRMSMGYQSQAQMSTIGSVWQFQNEPRSVPNAKQLSKTSTSDQRRPGSTDSINAYIEHHFNSMAADKSDQLHGKIKYQPIQEQFTDSKNGTARFNRTNLVSLNNSEKDDNHMPTRSTMRHSFSNYNATADLLTDEPLKSVHLNHATSRSPVLSHKPQLKSFANHSMQNTSISNKENANNSFERRLEQQKSQNPYKEFAGINDFAKDY